MILVFFLQIKVVLQSFYTFSRQITLPILPQTTLVFCCQNRPDN